jgi:arabinose-5-phosphate isomerase
MGKDILHRAPTVVPEFSQQVTMHEVLNFGREIIRTEADALEQLVGRLDETFYHAVSLLYALHGNLIITGIGKAGLIGQKLVATFASTGTRAHFLHPSEAWHGDLGRVCRGDVVLMLSQSGETGEVVQLLPSLRKINVPLVAITASRRSSVGQVADVTLSLGNLDEACSLGLAPSTSTTVMLALGDALALVVSRLRGFQTEDFAKFHPGGALGLKLSFVEEHMRDVSECRIAREDQTIREVLISSTRPGRRSGAILLVNQAGHLTGLFTDSDLARLIEQRNDSALDQPINHVMSAIPTVVQAGTRMNVAIELLAERKFSELPIVDTQGCPVGLIDVTDVVGLLPEGVETGQSDTKQVSEANSVCLYPREDAA